MCFIFIGLVFVSVFSAFPSFLYAEDVIEIKAATMHPLKQLITDDCFLQYGKEAEKRTNGRVKFKWYLAGSLIKFDRAEQAVKTGLVDMALGLPTYLHLKQYPISAAVGLPLIAESASHASLLLHKMYQNIPEMKEEYAHLKPLAFFTSAMANLHTIGSPPKNLDELKGMRILSVSKVSVPVLKALGASPREARIEDLYMTLQTHAADGVIFPDAPIKSLKLIEIISNHTMGPFFCAPQGYAMNLKKWQSLPPDIQKVFEDLTLSAGCLGAATLDNESEWVIRELKKRGDTFYYLPSEEKAKWTKAVRPIHDEWIADLDSRGWNGRAIYEKVLQLREETLNNPYKPDAWWGRAGKLD
jgi:TRAP-type C4-dicarboxylate transport system substrate-binding protein